MTAHRKNIDHLRRMGIGGMLAAHAAAVALKIVGVVAGATLMIYVPRLKAISSVFGLFAGVHLVGLAVVVVSLYALGGRAIARRRPREGVGMRTVACPRCGAEFIAHSDDELIDAMQHHAKTVHHHDVPREHIVRYVEKKAAGTDLSH